MPYYANRNNIPEDFRQVVDLMQLSDADVGDYQGPGKEHLALTEKYFPTEEALNDYLEGCGVSLEKIC